MQFFGFIGLIAIFLGMLGSTYIAFKKLVLDVGIFTTHGPLFIVSMFSILTGIQFIVFGILSDVLIRIYHTTNERKTYKIRETVNMN